MTDRVRAFVGILTTVVFVVAGMAVYSEGNIRVGALLMGLGMFRGIYAAQHVMSVLGLDDEDDRSPPGPPKDAQTD